MVVWLAHESDESMCKPSNLKEVTLSMVPVGVVRNGRFERAKEPSIISLVLVVFISMLFSFAQETRLKFCGIQIEEPQNHFTERGLVPRTHTKPER